MYIHREAYSDIDSNRQARNKNDNKFITWHLTQKLKKQKITTRLPK